MDVKYTFKLNAKWILKTRKDEILVLSELPLSGEAIVDRFKLDEIGIDNMNDFSQCTNIQLAKESLELIISNQLQRNLFITQVEGF